MILTYRIQDTHFEAFQFAAFIEVTSGRTTEKPGEIFAPLLVNITNDAIRGINVAGLFSREIADALIEGMMPVISRVHPPSFDRIETPELIIESMHGG